MEYVDDWYCRECGYGPLGEEVDECPECGTPWEGLEDEEWDPVPSPASMGLSRDWKK